jgi:DNA uptake protein ComE-like DNA-binding protein
MSSRPAHLLSAAAVTLGLLAAACGGGDSPTVASDSTTTTAASSATTADTTASTSSSTAMAKVNANTASVAELTSALDAAGVSNAARWAKEVEEYRPYPTNDPTFAKLKQNLAKYNPVDDVVNGIISALSL